MSYLDKPLTRESYFEHISTKSHSHIVNCRIALDWFEKFCLGRFDGKTMTTILSDSMKQKYDNPQRHSQNLYSVLQDFINYLSKNGHDPSTVRINFNLTKNYLNWYGFEVYTESVKSRLNFPKKIEEEAYPLTLEDIELIVNNASPQRRVLYLFLSSTGMRIQETLKLRKRDLNFDHDRIMVVIAGKYTKTRKPRKTFITKETEKLLVEVLKKRKDDDLIFATNEDSLKSKHTEEDYFYRLRNKIGLTERYDTGIHKITLHSFRSWFVTKCNRVDSDLGNALAGHGKYMKKYDRLTIPEMIDLFIKAEPTLSIFEHIDDSENQAKIEELEAKLEEMSSIKKDHEKIMAYIAREENSRKK
jgi:integrase